MCLELYVQNCVKLCYSLESVKCSSGKEISLKMKWDFCKNFSYNECSN